MEIKAGDYVIGNQSRILYRVLYISDHYSHATVRIIDKPKNISKVDIQYLDFIYRPTSDNAQKEG